MCPIQVYFEFVNLTDVFFEPLIAQRVLNSRQWDIQTAKNDALLMTADTYFRVHQYRGMYAGALYCVERGRDLVEQIASLSDELVSMDRGRARPQPARRPRAAIGLRATGVARPERQAHPRSPAEPARGGRPARARSSSAHLDRPRPAAPRPAEDRPDQPPRSRLEARAGRGGGRADQPGEDAPAPPPRHHRRLPEPRRHDDTRQGSSAWAPTAASISGPAGTT